MVSSFEKLTSQGERQICIHYQVESTERNMHGSILFAQHLATSFLFIAPVTKIVTTHLKGNCLTTFQSKNAEKALEAPCPHARM